ncbi:MAG: AEC family transporter [Kiloniellales bacterium]
MSEVLIVTLPFFAVVACGYLAGRFDVLSAAALDGLNAFVYYFALPALLFRVFALRPLQEILEWSFLGAYVAGALPLFVGSAVICRLWFRVGFASTVLHGLGSGYGNVGYLAIPLAVGVYGEAAALPAALVLFADLMFFVTLAIFLIELSRGAREQGARALLSVVPTVLLNPFLLAILVGLAVSASGFGLARPLDGFLVLLGAAASPCALFALGASLVGRNVAGDLRAVAVMLVLKLLVMPPLVWLSMTEVFAVPRSWAVVATLAAAMPLASTTFVLAQRYDINPRRFSTAVLISTALSVVTVPLVVALTGG